VNVYSEVTTSFLSADSLLYQVDHRPWLPPSGPWVMTQTWNDLGFFHYAVEPPVLRALVPPELTLDLYQGAAWLSVIPFWMSNIRPPGIPAIPVLSTMPELNVRTYVTCQGKPGIYFFSLDAGNLSAVWAARLFYRLPYWHAAMKAGREKTESGIVGGPVCYTSKRIHGPAAVSGPPEFKGRYKPFGIARPARPRSLDHFLLERYCLYAVTKKHIYRGEVHHLPYILERCEFEIEKNTMAEPIGLHLPQNPDLAHYSAGLKVLIWAPEKLK
jgi:uncharacterized protein